MTKKSKRELTKQARARKFSEASKRAIRSGDTEAVAKRYQINHSSLIKYMKSSDSLDLMREGLVERTALKVQKAASKKGDLAIQFAGAVESLLDDLAEAEGAEAKERIAKAVGTIVDKYLLILGDPTFILAASVGTHDGGVPGTEHTAMLERIAARRGIQLPGMREIEQVDAEDAEIVDDEPEPEPDPEWDGIVVE